jgi:hypothetical protein
MSALAEIICIPTTQVARANWRRSSGECASASGGRRRRRGADWSAGKQWCGQGLRLDQERPHVPDRLKRRIIRILPPSRGAFLGHWRGRRVG